MICKWTKIEDQELTELALSRKWMYSEIAEKLSRKPWIVRHRAKKLNLPSVPCPEKIGGWNRKHSHLRKDVMQYYMEHTATECQKKFNLSEGEFKSLMTKGYVNSNFTHLRKETRPHTHWSLDDWLFVVRNCGILTRGTIAKKIGRSINGRAHAIKEKLTKIGGGKNNKFLNGMPISWAETMWPTESFLYLTIKTKAGSSGGKKRGNFNFKLIPWIELEKLVNKCETPILVKRCIFALAKFQRFIHQQKDELITDSIKKIIKDN